MCGRLNVHADPLARVFVLLTGQPFPGESSPNVAPTEQAWVITPPGSGREAAEDVVAPHRADAIARPMRWWLVPYWSSDPKPRYSMFNARSDALRSSRAFRGAFERRRCLVPVTGFYEWIKEGTRRLPQHVTAADGGALLLAGIWEHWHSDTQAIDSFALVTTDVNPALAFLHDRQPAMLDIASGLRWIDRATGAHEAFALLNSELPVDLAVTPVSEYVNNPRHKGEECTVALGNPRFVAAS